jgi:hypothetical protein
LFFFPADAGSCSSAAFDFLIDLNLNSASDSGSSSGSSVPTFDISGVFRPRYDPFIGSLPLPIEVSSVSGISG